MKPTLLVLAAGMGSRFGGLKQIAPMGPNGETLLDYSVFDALRAGFGRVVFVIRPDFADQFKSAIGDRFSPHLPVDYAWQTLDSLPGSFAPPVGRTKPWGTGHAVLAAQGVIQENFCVINADDFYGREAYSQMAHYFQQSPLSAPDCLLGCMVGYRLRQTLSPHGSVSRGICQLGTGDQLVSVEEMTKIVATPNGAEHRMEGQPVTRLSGEEIVSLNFWGLTPYFFSELETQFLSFLEKHGQELTSEFYLPFAIDHLIQKQQAQIKVLATESPWFGVTYREDQPRVQSALQALIRQGEYPDRLFDHAASPVG